VIVVEYDPSYVSETILYRVNAGGPQLPAADGSAPNWSEDQSVANAGGDAQTGTPSPYVNAAAIGDNTFGVTDTIALDAAVPPQAPMELYQTERYDVSQAPEMQWDFPIAGGTLVEVRLYLAEIFDGITGPGQRVFDVAVEGSVPAAFDALDPYGLTGAIYGGTMVSTTTTVENDDNLDLNFIHLTQNPAIKAIEIVQLQAPPPSTGPVITLTNPVDGAIIPGDQITVSWTTTNTNAGDHVHLTLDNNPYVGGLSLSGTYVFTNVVTGAHVITAEVASTSHVVYTNSEATDVISVNVIDTQAEICQDAVIAINAGGAQYTSGAGVTFLAEQYATGGNTYSISSGTEILRTADDIIYTSEHYGDPFTYTIPITDGNYIVELHFAEIFHGVAGADPIADIGDRVFNANVEGVTVLTDFDIIAEVGKPLTAVSRRFPVTVSDGDVVISGYLGSSGVDNAKVSAICILSVSNQPPAIEPVADQTVEEGQMLDITTSIADPDGETLAVTVNSVPNASTFTTQLITDTAPGVYSLTLTFSPLTGDAGSYDFTITAEDETNAPVVETFTLTVTEPTADFAGAHVEINPGSNIDASTFNGGFIIENTSTGSIQIASVSYDLDTAIYPNMVFDPNGTAGDSAGQCLQAVSGATATGFVTPTDNCNDPYSVPHGNGGYYVATVDFTDFDPGELFEFTSDVDPTSIEGAGTTGAAGSVSGLELAGATVTVTFTNGASQVIAVQTYRIPGSDGGSQNDVLTDPLPSAPGIQVVGVAGPDATVTETNQIVELTGPANANVALLVIESGMLDPQVLVGAYEANQALAITEYVDTLDGSGTADISITLQDNSAAGNLYYLAAVVEATDGRTSNLSQVWRLALEPPEPPPQAAICINAGGAAYTAANGLSFLADTYFTAPTGGTYSVGQPITDTVDDTLFQTERYGDPFTYTVPVSDGDYIVDLMFAEIYHGVTGGNPSGGVGSRVFSVEIEGTAVLTDYDVFAQAGGALTAITETFTVTVSGGAADIGFTASVDFAKVSALCVMPVVTPPVAPTLTISRTATDAILSWTDSPANAEYELYVATTPYFTAATGSVLTTTTGNSYTHVNVIGDGTNHYYFVRAYDAGATQSADSNRVGEFEFPLVPGTAAPVANGGLAEHAYEVQQGDGLYVGARRIVDIVMSILRPWPSLLPGGR
jgi:hypothetical protein